MTAAARKRAAPAVRLSALAVFVARAQARATLWRQASEFDLHHAVDVLQADGERDGLVDQIGQDEVQRIIAEAFAKVS
jgi:hypothetical protein